MRKIETIADIEEGLAHLLNVEPRFQLALDITGTPPLRRKPAGFAAMIQILTAQQVSVASATSIWQRMEAAGATSAAVINRMTEDELRACGLSRPKVKYAKAISAATLDKSLDFDALQDMPIPDAISMMTAVKGVGRWTAEIYLMFNIGHRDMFAPGDLALQEAARILFDLPERPPEKWFDVISRPWSPWQGVAARLLWAYYGALKGREGIK